jgi:hypothetical protein
MKQTTFQNHPITQSLNHSILLWVGSLLLLVLAVHCSAPRKPVPGQRIPPKRDRRAEPPRRNEPMDTIRWTPAPPGTRPPIGKPDQRPQQPGRYGDTYRIGLLLPFLTDEVASGSEEVPEKSRLALQFYSGAKIAMAQLSREEGLNLVVDVYDTQAGDTEFRRLFSNPRFDKSDVYIGPIRPSHVGMMAERTKANRKILVSPESPNMDLTAQNPDFIQTNPSLRAHCAGITRFVRKKHSADAVTLVCKEKEADRLPFFQQTNTSVGGPPLAELIVPDATANFESIDLRPYIKPGRTSVFILPTWSSQDFVMAFFRKLRAVKGGNRVEVYGMPQWRNFESIDAEFLLNLNVHVSAASYIDYTAENVRTFQESFYEATGTIPDDDAFNGYDVTMLVGKMLRKYGLSFPERLPREWFDGLHTDFRFTPVNAAGGLEGGSSTRYDYLENTYVHILKFDQYGFVPAE